MQVQWLSGVCMGLWVGKCDGSPTHSVRDNSSTLDGEKGSGHLNFTANRDTGEQGDFFYEAYLPDGRTIHETELEGLTERARAIIKACLRHRGAVASILRAFSWSWCSQ